MMDTRALIALTREAAGLCQELLITRDALEGAGGHLAALRAAYLSDVIDWLFSELEEARDAIRGD